MTTTSGSAATRRSWRSISVIGVVAAAVLLGWAGHWWLDGRSEGPLVVDCGAVDQFCPDELAERFRSAADCRRLDDLVIEQLTENPYYFFDPYGREQTWHTALGQRWQEMGCDVDYR